MVAKRESLFGRERSVLQSYDSRLAHGEFSFLSGCLLVIHPGRAEKKFDAQLDITVEELIDGLNQNHEDGVKLRFEIEPLQCNIL